jgi:hypothetical protein
MKCGEQIEKEWGGGGRGRAGSNGECPPALREKKGELGNCALVALYVFFGKILGWSNVDL